MTHITADNAKLRITQVLRDAKRTSTVLTAEEISRLSGVPIDHAKRRLSAFVQEGRVTNHGKRCGLYEWAGPGEWVTTIPTWRDASRYTGEKPVPMRPGAGDFLTYGSRVGDEVIPRTRVPYLMSYRGEE